jgi:hypothetical protein
VPQVWEGAWETQRLFVGDGRSVFGEGEAACCDVGLFRLDTCAGADEVTGGDGSVGVGRPSSGASCAGGEVCEKWSLKHILGITGGQREDLEVSHSKLERTGHQRDELKICQTEDVDFSAGLYRRAVINGTKWKDF